MKFLKPSTIAKVVKVAVVVAKTAAVRIVTGQAQGPAEKIIEVAVKQLIVLGFAWIGKRMGGFPPAEASAT